MPFDPNKPFTPVKRPFDPSKPFQPARAPQQAPDTAPLSYTPGGIPGGALQANPPADRALAKIGVGLATGGLAPEIEGGGLLNSASRALTNAGGTGIQQYLSNLIDKKQDPTSGVGAAATIGGLISPAADAASGVMGGMADRAMLRAAGLTKYLKGVGNQLANMGIWGTKGGMSEGVANNLAQKEGELKDLVSGLRGNVSGKDMADAIMQKAQDGSQLVTRSGRTLNSLKPDVDAVHQAAAQFDPSVIGAEGPIEQLSPNDLLDFKRQGEFTGYTNSGNPATSTQAGIGRAIANKARGALSEMSDDKTANLLKDEQALVLAQKSLGKPETLSKMPLDFRDISGAGVGRMLGIPGGAEIGMGINEAARYPLVNSLFGQAMQKGANASSAISNPAVLQSLFGAANASNSSGQ